MTRIGAILAIAGFGSLLLGLINVHFILLAWADPMQPWFGLVVGLVGAVVLVLGIVQERSAEQEPAQ